VATSQQSGVIRLMKHRSSEYMNWAKLHSRARYNLATSGVAAFPLRELGITLDQLEINGDSTYGYAPLQQAIAAKCGVDPSCVVAAAGTSMANHLAMAALLEPGDEVLMEHPTYELLISTAQYFDVSVKSFPRQENQGYAIDPSAVRKALSPKTKLIVVTNLHNPSSVLTSDATLREVGAIARQAGVHVLVDEVYLDAVYENTPRSSFHLGPEFIVTNSLTKVYGLSGLRCGWILAQPALAQKMWRLNDLFGSIPAHPAELLSLIALQNLNKIRERTRKIVQTDRAVLAQFLAEHLPAHVSAAKTQFGTTTFLGMKKGNTDEFLSKLRRDYDTSVVPGRFFGMANHFRVGMGVDSTMFQEGLMRISKALGA
jgi:aspartate/methionine/tyrosine aminotransferase